MAEQLQAQQISQAYFVLRNTQRDNRRGHWLGFLTTILAMVCALGCLFLDYPWVALAFVSIPVMAVAKALVKWPKHQQQLNQRLQKKLFPNLGYCPSSKLKRGQGATDVFSGLPRELRNAM